MKTNLSILLLFFFVNSAFGQTKFAQLEEVLLMLHKQDQFNGSILIAEKGKVTFKKSYGLSNQENKQLFNENTIFELASVSKQFTAMGIVILKEKGKLSYEDKVTKFFPELEEYKNISVRNLLNHTNGIPDYLSPKYFAFFDKSKINSNKDVIEMLVKNKVKPTFEPNTKFAYSNTGYILLASIIEKVSGQTFASFLQKSIFKPLKMNRTFVYQRRLAPRKIDNYAFGYIPTDDLKAYILPDNYEQTKFVFYLDGIVGDGNISSTVNDLLKWDRALYTDKLVPKQSLKEVFSPTILEDKKATNYGFGWIVENNKEYGEIVSHSGGFPGYRTYIERHITNDKTIIILQNRDGTSLPRKNIREVLYNQPLTKMYRRQIQVSPELLEKYIGDYQDKTNEKSIISLTKGDNWLFYNSTENKGWNLPLFAESNTLFFAKPLDIQIEFVLDGDKVSMIKLHQGGKIIGEATKIK